MTRILPRWLQLLGAPCTAVAVLAGCGAAETTVKPTDDPAKSKAAFMEMAQVLTHPRCLNCHPQGDSPTNGDAMTAHQPPVVRGDTGMGAPGMRCNACHGETNVALLERAGSVPGAPAWHLAPASMAWQGKSLGEICEQLKDPSRNGNRSLEEIYQHNREDPLVGWAWAPGRGRTPAPGTQDEFARQVRAWVDYGAHCPDR